MGSLAIGLAAQDTLANMFAGFTLMLDRPFRVGDRIQLSTGEVGDVEEIGMRATRIRTLDETILVVPNSLLVKERVVNLSRPTAPSSPEVEVGVAYGSDRGAGEGGAARGRAGLAAAWTARASRWCCSRASAISPYTSSWCSGRAITRSRAPARSEVHEEIYRGLAAAGIEIRYARQVRRAGAARRTA